MTNNYSFSANFLSIYHTPALWDMSYDKLAIDFKVIRSLIPIQNSIIGEMPYSKKGT